MASNMIKMMICLVGIALFFNLVASQTSPKDYVNHTVVFNTNTNYTVVQTYNDTTYNNCTADYSLDNDTFIYNAGDKELGKAVTISIPLIFEGSQYYFSDGDDGEQCLQGMAFEIKVSRGLGLPPSLNQPPPPAYVPPPAPADEGESPPGTIGGTPTTDSANMGATMPWVASGLAMLFLHHLVL
ncbi:hypothetical protein Leryth_014856 [Lithospermum erythrorhizon]|nr:hypothetical protein Leryth_014856 [Lithospermum erythrorhizon]